MGEFIVVNDGVTVESDEIFCFGSGRSAAPAYQSGMRVVSILEELLSSLTSSLLSAQFARSICILHVDSPLAYSAPPSQQMQFDCAGILTIEN